MAACIRSFADLASIWLLCRTSVLFIVSSLLFFFLKKIFFMGHGWGKK